ncbi:hypothetical protein K1X84_08810 [bacterium]|nr:hypothetical protein [bacterium]
MKFLKTVLFSISVVWFACKPEASTPYLTAAKEAAQWIRSTERNGIWPDAEGDSVASYDIGSGIAGKTVFFAELYLRTGDESYRRDARKGADYILSQIPPVLKDSFPPQSGFYNGIGGAGFILHEMFKITGEKKYDDGARQCIQLILKSAKRHNGRASWSAFNDLLFGDAGTGLFLMYAYSEMNDQPSLELAKEISKNLLDSAQHEPIGLNWKFRKGAPFILPNFSHGTAGISYFFLSLYSLTKDERYLKTALEGTAYMQSIAKTDDGIFLVPYGWPNPAWKDLYETGWAHGAAGTARLFYRLSIVTGDKTWMERVKACGDGIRASGIPGAPAAGFSTTTDDMRFGLASVTDFFSFKFSVSRDSADIHFAKQIADTLLSRSVIDDNGRRWIMPAFPFLSKSDTPKFPTGYFYGAAGYGLMLLHLDAAMTGRSPAIRFPDNPF